MTSKLAEWEKHVRAAVEPTQSYCGVRLYSLDWAFVDARHALDSIATSRLQPCPECLKQIQASLDFEVKENRRT